MWLKENTYTQQSLLSLYTRTGDEHIISKLNAVKIKGIQYYRHLIFNIIWDGISNAYPITTDFFGEEKMKELVNDFFAHHKCQTFQVWQMPKEFKDYIISHRQELCHQYLFLPDLLLFEWIEVEMFMMPDEDLPIHVSQGHIMKDKLIINPEIQILLLQYPVHIKHPKFIDIKDKAEYFVLVHRHPDDKDVFFTQISASSAKIIEALYENPLNMDEIQALFPKHSLKQKEQIKQFIRECIQNKIIIGFQKVS